MAMTEMDFAALGLVDDAGSPGGAGGADGLVATGSSGRSRKSRKSRSPTKRGTSKHGSTAAGAATGSEMARGGGGFGTGGKGHHGKKGAHRRAHRRSTQDAGSNLDNFLSELDPTEVRKPSTRGLRNHANQMPTSYEQPAWMQYKQRAGADAINKKSRRSGAGYEGKTAGGSRGVSPKRVNSLVGGTGGVSSTGEAKVGTPRERIATLMGAGAGAGEGKRSVADPRAAGAVDGCMSPAAAAASASTVTPRGEGSTSGSGNGRTGASRGAGGGAKKASRRGKKSEKTKAANMKSVTQPKKQAAAFPSINGMRSVASLLAGPQAQRTIDLNSMRAVGVTKKQHEKPVSMKKQHVGGSDGGSSRSQMSAGDAFLRKLEKQKKPLSPSKSMRVSHKGFS